VGRGWQNEIWATRKLQHRDASASIRNGVHAANELVDTSAGLCSISADRTGSGGRHGGFEWGQPQPRLNDRQVAREGPAALPSHEKALTYNNLIDRPAYHPMVNADAYSISISAKPRRPAMTDRYLRQGVECGEFPPLILA